MTPEYGGLHRSFSILLICGVLLLSGIAINLNGDINSQTRSGSQIEITSLNVEASIKNSFATTTIRQAIFNNATSSQNETFLFKIPEGAFITNFSVIKNRITHYAKLYTKEVAEQKYSNAVQSGTSAGLLLSRGTTKFSYGISFAPGDRIVVSLTYDEYIEKHLGDYSYDLYLSGINQNRIVPEVNLNISIKALDQITRINATGNFSKVKTTWNSISSCDVEFIETDVKNLSNLHIRYGIKDQPPSGKFLTYKPGNQTYFFHVVTPTSSTLTTKPLRKDIVFVLDKSGSMSGEKISQLKNAFKEIIWELDSTDRFNIIMFDSGIKSYWDQLKLASDTNKSSGISYVTNLSAGGSTNLNDGLELALTQLKQSSNQSNNGVPIIVLLTDGLANHGKFTTPNTIRQNIRNLNTYAASIFTLGFGFNVDFPFLKALALENHGMGIRIYDDIDAADQLIDFYKMISTPLLANITFNYQPWVTEVYPGRADYLFNGSEIIITGKIADNVTTVNSSIQALAGNGSIYLNGTFSVKPDSNNSYIEKYWAFAKINHLIDRITIEGETNSTIKEITNLSLKYGFVTPYTALFVEVGTFNLESSSSSTPTDGGGGAHANSPGGYSGGGNSADGTSSEDQYEPPEVQDPSINPLEADSDGDGFADAFDDFPADRSRWCDFNLFDSDGDGYNNVIDAFPDDPYEWIDSDGDRIGDNSDMFPEDPDEWNDADGDGFGDNGDEFPENPNEWIDTDKDGYGDNIDDFPNDPNNWRRIEGNITNDNIVDESPHDLPPPLVDDNGDHDPKISVDEVPEKDPMKDFNTDPYQESPGTEEQERDHLLYNPFLFMAIFILSFIIMMGSVLILNRKDKIQMNEKS